MVKVYKVREKMDAMIFQLQFESRYNWLIDEINLVSDACDALRNSPKLKKMLGIILSLGNRMNTMGSPIHAATGFKLVTLLKLHEVSLGIQFCLHF